MIAHWLLGLVRGWNSFWFESDGRGQVRLFRMGFGLLLFGFYLVRSLDLDLYYSDQGIMTLAALPDLLPMEYRHSIFHHFNSHFAIWVGNWVFLASLLLFAFGILPRLMAITALVLHVSFIHRNPAVAYGADTISCFFLWFMTLADYRDDSTYRPGDLTATIGSMAYRLCQIQVCVIYGYSGLKKLKGTTWWNGEAVWNSLADPQLARWDFTWLSHFPLLLAGAAFMTLAWEIYFPALVWMPKLRLPFLILGVGLHVGIGVGLNLPFFGTLMVLTYVFFLDRALVAAVTAPLARAGSCVKDKLYFFKVPGPTSD